MSLLSRVARIYYEGIIDNLSSRLKTIDTKEKSKHYSSEITVIKMIIVLLTNLLSQDSK